MEAQLKELIEKIKKDGVESAEEEASRIIEEANKKAGGIVEDAKKEADNIRENAEQEAQKRLATGDAKLRQAGRDLLLSLEKEITNVFEAIVNREISTSLDDKVMSEAVLTVLKKWSEGNDVDLQVLLPEQQRNKVESYLKDKLSEKIKMGLEIKPFEEIDSGFYIAEKDGSAYYNFSSEGIAEILTEFLNPRLSKILQEAAQKE